MTCVRCVRPPFCASYLHGLSTHTRLSRANPATTIIVMSTKMIWKSKSAGNDEKNEPISCNLAYALVLIGPDPDKEGGVRVLHTTVYRL